MNLWRERKFQKKWIGRDSCCLYKKRDVGWTGWELGRGISCKHLLNINCWTWPLKRPYFIARSMDVFSRYMMLLTKFLLNGWSDLNDIWTQASIVFLSIRLGTCWGALFPKSIENMNFDDDWSESSPSIVLWGKGITWSAFSSRIQLISRNLDYQGNMTRKGMGQFF